MSTLRTEKRRPIRYFLLIDLLSSRAPNPSFLNSLFLNVDSGGDDPTLLRYQTKSAFSETMHSAQFFLQQLAGKKQLMVPQKAGNVFLYNYQLLSVLPLSRKIPFFGWNLRNFERLKEFFKFKEFQGNLRKEKDIIQKFREFKESE